MKLNLFWVFLALALLTAGCATRSASKARNVPGMDPPENVSEIVTRGESHPYALVPEPVRDIPQEITLASALALTLKQNPSLSGFSAEIRARDAAALQVGVIPNPEFGVDVENFGGQDSLQGFDGAETTLAFSQRLEMGGKRGNRRIVADLDKTLAQWDYQGKRLDVLASTGRAFVEVLFAQEQAALNDEMFDLAQETTTAVQERVEAGKVSPIEASWAQIELAVARIEAEKAARKLEAARARLAACWGGERTVFDRAVGRFCDIVAPPAEEVLQALLGGNPDLARWATEMERSEAMLSLARSEAFPDVTLSGGVRNFQETDDNAFVFGISVPIPFFDRNQGGISEARARVERARSEHLSTRVALSSGLSDTWQSLSAAYAEAVGLRDEILSGAQATYESTRFGYREGKLDFLQMLEAQRTLFAIKRQYLLSLEAYHLAFIDIKRILGVSPSETAGQNNNGTEDLEFEK